MKKICMVIAAVAISGLAGQTLAAPVASTDTNIVAFASAAGDKFVANYEAFAKRYKAAIAKVNKNDPMAMVELAKFSEEQAKLSAQASKLQGSDLTPEHMAKIAKLNAEISQALMKLQ